MSSYKQGKINKLTETQKAYIAGMIDADGSVGIDRRTSESDKYPYNFAVRVLVVNTDYDLILWLKKVIGAGCAYKTEYRYKPNWNTVHRYQLTNEKGVELLNQIIPYMIVKRERAELVASLPTRKTMCSKKGRSVENYALQNALYEQVSILNKRGI